MRSSSLTQMVLLGAFAVHAAIHERVADLPRKDFDYIVIGGMSDRDCFEHPLICYVGGTAGNVIANRLTENAAVSVLVLEAGGT